MEELLNLTNTTQGTITALATVVIALMAVVTGALTIGLIRENRLLRKAGTEPNVAAYLTTDSRHKTMVNLVLANIGQGAARNVEFRFDADEQDFASHNVQLSNKADRTAIAVLPQGEKIEAFFGAGHELYRDPRLRPFKVIIEYEDIKGRHQSSAHLLDVSQFDGLITLGAPAEHEMAEALKKIEHHIGHLATGFNRLKVETITVAEAREEAKENRQRAREQLEKQMQKQPHTSDKAPEVDC